MKGSIVRKRDEGYGFIKPEDGDKDVFFHATSLGDVDFDSLNEGDVVTFDVEEGPKGPAATNIAKADDAVASDDSASDDSAPAADEGGEEAA